MDTTLTIWLVITVVVLFWGVFAFAQTGEDFFLGIAFIAVVCIGLGVFLLYGNSSVDGAKTVEVVKEFDVKEYPNYILISTPKGEMIQIKTLADKAFFETNKQLYYIWHTNHYNSAMGKTLSIRP